LHGRAVHSVQHAGDDVAFALDGTDDGEFERVALSPRLVAALVQMAVVVFSTDKRLVHFDKADQLAEFFIRQSGADPMAHNLGKDGVGRWIAGPVAVLPTPQLVV
jgi:hypothetical protein